MDAEEAYKRVAARIWSPQKEDVSQITPRLYLEADILSGPNPHLLGPTFFFFFFLDIGNYKKN